MIAVVVYNFGRQPNPVFGGEYSEYSHSTQAHPGFTSLSSYHQRNEIRVQLRINHSLMELAPLANRRGDAKARSAALTLLMLYYKRAKLDDCSRRDIGQERG